MFNFTRPVFTLTDVDAIKQITTKDFDFFVNRDAGLSHGVDALLGKSVLFLENNPWREMRNIL